MEKTFEGIIKSLKYPNMTLDRLVMTVYSMAYNESTRSECSFYNIPLSTLNRIRVLLGVYQEDLKLLFKVPNSWRYFNNDKIRILFYLYIYYLYNKSEKYAKISLYLLGIQTYVGLMVKYFTKCDENIMKGAFSLMRSTAIAKKYGTIGVPLVISNRMHDKYKISLISKGLEDEKFRLVFLSEFRHKLNQAVKNIATRYYLYFEKKGNTKVVTDKMTHAVDVSNAVSNIVTKFVMYNDVRHDVIYAICKYMGAPVDKVSNVISEIVSDKELVRTILQRLATFVKDKETFCKSDYVGLYKLIYLNRKVSSELKAMISSHASKRINEWNKFSNLLRTKIVFILLIYLIFELKLQLCSGKR